jgi:Tfp pilus assembly protein PilO
MKRKLTKEQSQSILLGLLVAAVFLYVLVVLFIGPARREAQQVGQQLPTARERMRALEFGTMNEAILRSQYEQMEQSVGSLRAVLPSEDTLSSSIETLSDLADTAQVKIQTIFPLRGMKDVEQEKDQAPATPAVFKEVLIQIDALAGFHQLGAFISAMETSPKPMRLSSLRISANPNEVKRHTAKIVIRAYFAPTQGSL